VVRKRTDYTRNESSREHSLPGTKVPSWERKFPGTIVPRSKSSWELSFLGSEERKYRGSKSPDTRIIGIISINNRIIGIKIGPS